VKDVQYTNYAQFFDPDSFGRSRKNLVRMAWIAGGPFARLPGRDDIFTR
jgi:hypothetical protein